MDMEAWLYDEDRWPSGAAGGLVTKDPRYRQHRLRVALATPRSFKTRTGLLATFAARITPDRRLASVRPLTAKTRPRTDEQVLSFEVVTAPCEDWYNGYTYLDTLSHEAVQKFIDVTHKKYTREIGEHYGPLVPGIFTDEPNYGHVWRDAEPGPGEKACWTASWTPKLPKVFKQRYGYDISPLLPEVFFDIEGQAVSQPRYHYFDCLTFLFVDAFARQIGQYCDEVGLLHTGHVLAEGSPSSQTNVVGSAMRFYEHMQAPGIDVLREANREYDTAKQCASVAEQTGRRWVLSELYGCTGWQFPFEGHKAVGDWQAALGVNLRCQHLSWYTMAGQAKRDYPASIFCQSPWWELYPTVEDYFARVGVLMSEGRAVRELLVVHPLESTWLCMGAGAAQETRRHELDRRLETLRDWLLEANLDFDYGDEEMLARLASVRGKGAAPRLRVGKAEYAAVLVPPTITLRATTVKLLQRFAKAGGAVVMARPVAGFVDAAESNRARTLAARVKEVPFERNALLRALEKPARVLSILGQDRCEAAAVLYNLRENGNERYLFVCNTDRKEGTGPLEIVLEDKCEVEEWDPADGSRWKAAFRNPRGRTRIRTELAASGSRLFVLKSKCEKTLTPRPTLHDVSRLALKPGTWDIRRAEPNVLVLDRPRFRIGGGNLQGPMEVLKADARIRSALDIPHRGGRMVQPWARKRSRGGPAADVVLEYTFEAETIPGGELALALEQPERFCIRLNGFILDADADAGWWTDRCLRRIPVDPGFVRRGENVLELMTPFDENTDLEAMFLLGEFGVRVDGTRLTLIRPPRTLHTGDWVTQGLPFYSGAIAYLGEMERPGGGDRVLLTLPALGGACVRVIVNGALAGVIGWQPYEVDLTEHLRPGRNELVVEVVSHRRNSFGPLHHRETVTPWTGPGEFVTQGRDWREDYSLIECGLLADPEIVVRRAK
jgi:hypothetical protein